MNELQPSRKDENFRYTQISLPLEGWEEESFKNTPFKESSVFSTWAKDFYLEAFQAFNCPSLDFSQIEIPSEGYCLHSSSEKEKTKGALNIKVPKQKSVKIFEHLENASERSLFVRNIVVEEGACLEYFVLQSQSYSNTFVLRHFFDVHPNAQVKFRVFHKGAKKGQHRIYSRIAKGASFVLDGATRLQNSQHIDLWAEAEHVGAHSHSQTTVWNVLNDEAAAVFNGMIRIQQNCPQTQAYQSNKSLLLSAQTRIYTLPKLEIFTDDVKCSHGASVSSLDETQLFYLQSRGISPHEAEKMLVEAFTMPVLLHLPQNFLQEEQLTALGLKGDVDGF
jgi:FeS assembly protein SufD